MTEAERLAEIERRFDEARARVLRRFDEQRPIGQLSLDVERRPK